MAQPEFTKKCCYSWWLLGMIPFSINQFQTHRHSMKTLPEFISKSRKIRKNPKTSICSNKKRMACHPKGTPIQGALHLFGSANTRTLQAKRPRRGLVICCPCGLAMGHTGSSWIIHVSPDGNVAELSLFLLMINIIQQTLCC